MKLLPISLHFIFFFSNCYYTCFANSDTFKLELVQILFRHGDRTPTEYEVYKTDPNAAIFEELGYGQLTKAGKQREYKLGKVLRERYDKFIGDYRVGNVHAQSTNTDRTKMSLHLLLAGLFPPTRDALWNEDIPWSPIPTYYEPTETDFLNGFESCPSYHALLEKRIAEAEQKLNVDQTFKEYLANSTGITFSLLAMKRLYLNLNATLYMNLPLPHWCSESDYKTIKELATVYYDASMDSASLAKFSAGPIVQTLLKNVDEHEKGAGARKIYLYSAHDFDMFVFTRAHNFTVKLDTPNYGSAVIVEKLRAPDDRVYIRMLVYDGVSEQWTNLKLRDCDHNCPLVEYKKLMEPVLPDDETKVCRYTPCWKTNALG